MKFLCCALNVPCVQWSRTPPQLPTILETDAGAKPHRQRSHAPTPKPGGRGQVPRTTDPNPAKHKHRSHAPNLEKEPSSDCMNMEINSNMSPHEVFNKEGTSNQRHHSTALLLGAHHNTACPLTHRLRKLSDSLVCRLAPPARLAAPLRASWYGRRKSRVLDFANAIGAKRQS